MLSRLVVLMGQEFRHHLRDGAVFVLLLGMPLLLIFFLKDSMEAALRLDPRTGLASGADHAVPGVGTMFVFFVANFMGLSFIRDHSWNMWTRIRVTRASTVEICAAKMAAYFVIGAVALATLLTIGWLFLGLQVRGSVGALALVGTLFVFAVVSTGMLLVAFVSRAQTLFAGSSLFAIVFAGLGGSLEPVSLLPGWARALSPLTPHFWAMEGFRTVVVHGGGFADVAECAIALAVYATVALVVAALRFRADETKLGY